MWNPHPHCEVAIQLENLLKSAHEAALEEQFRRDPQVQIDVERIGVRDERARGGTAGERLQHRGLDLEESAPFERRTHSADHRDALAGDGAGLGPDDEVDIALTHARFFAHFFVSNRKWPQRLCRHLPSVGQHRQFATLGTDDFAVDEHDVTEVHVTLPGVECLLAHLSEADHHLQLGAVALLQGREAQLARVAGKHHAAGDPDDLAGRGVGGQVGVGAAQFGQRVGAIDLHRVRIVPLRQQPLPLLLTDSELLGDIGLGLGRVVTIGWGHEIPA